MVVELYGLVDDFLVGFEVFGLEFVGKYCDVGCCFFVFFWIKGFVFIEDVVENG